MNELALITHAIAVAIGAIGTLSFVRLVSGWKTPVEHNIALIMQHLGLHPAPVSSPRVAPVGDGSNVLRSAPVAAPVVGPNT